MGLHSVVIPAAGMGTRMLPATRSVPKELLPVYDMPLLQFALNEAANAGARRVVLVSHPSKVALDDYVRSPTALMAALSRKGKVRELAELKRAVPHPSMEIEVVYQHEPLGLGHAVLQARDVIIGSEFGVILPDDLLLGGTTLGRMLVAYRRAGYRALVAAMNVPREEVSNYGVFDCEDGFGETRAARRLIEKPSVDTAPSTLAAIGRYILSTDILDTLAQTEEGAGGEIQLTDAIDALGSLGAFPITERRFDCGSKEGLFEASGAVREARHRTAGIPDVAAE